MESKVLNAITAYEAEILDFTKEMVNIDSGVDCPEGVRQITELIKEKLLPLGFKVELLESAGPVQLLATRPCEGAKKILLSGHTDTVFFKGEAAKRPFRIEDGIAYGPGVLDMKSGIAVLVYAVKALLENGWDKADLTIFIVGDEETNHPNTNAVENFKRVAQGKDACFNFELGRANGSVVIGRKGRWAPELHIKGIAAHAGNEPEKGASAITELCKKISDLADVNDYASGTSCNVGVISGGSLANVVAEYAEAKLDIRYTTMAEAAKAVEKVKAIVAKNYDERTTTELVEAGPHVYTPPMETTEGVKRLYRFVKAQAEKLGQAELGAMIVGGSADANYVCAEGVPTICSMGPAGVGPHSNNEYVFVKSFVERAQLAAMSIMHLDELDNF